MLSGTYSLPKVAKEMVCRNTKDYYFVEVGLYQIHSTTLMTYIPFGESDEWKEKIEKELFVNDEETKPQFDDELELQNYITTKYIGRAPLEWYEPGLKTKIGRKFVLVCDNGVPMAKYRYFGTESAIHDFNRSANENEQYSGGGE